MPTLPSHTLLREKKRRESRRFLFADAARIEEKKRGKGIRLSGKKEKKTGLSIPFRFRGPRKGGKGSLSVFLRTIDVKGGEG